MRISNHPNHSEEFHIIQHARLFRNIRSNIAADSGNVCINRV
jgi:hypothetical protein